MVHSLIQKAVYDNKLTADLHVVDGELARAQLTIKIVAAVNLNG